MPMTSSDIAALVERGKACLTSPSPADHCSICEESTDAAFALVRELLAAVEQLQRERDNGVAFCSFCGWHRTYAVGAPEQDAAAVAVALHVAQCKEHPLTKRAEAAEAALREAQATIQQKG